MKLVVAAALAAALVGCSSGSGDSQETPTPATEPAPSPSETASPSPSPSPSPVAAAERYSAYRSVEHVMGGVVAVMGEPAPGMCQAQDAIHFCIWGEDATDFMSIGGYWAFFDPAGEDMVDFLQRRLSAHILTAAGTTGSPSALVVGPGWTVTVRGGPDSDPSPVLETAKELADGMGAYGIYVDDMDDLPPPSPDSIYTEARADEFVIEGTEWERQD